MISEATTPKPTTPKPTTQKPTTPKPTTAKPITESPSGRILRQNKTLVDSFKNIDSFCETIKIF